MPRLIARERLLGEIRPMTKEDVGGILKKPFYDQLNPRKLRDSHHRIARLLAVGMRPKDVAAKTGYTISRISGLSADPAMQELIAVYRVKVDAKYEEAVDDFYEIAFSNMIKAERQISDKLDKADEEEVELSIKDLILVSRDAADRFGYGKRQTNINVNTDFAAELEKARARSGKVIEVVPEDGKLKRRF